MMLFVWSGDGVLQDYTSGMIVAIGKDLQDALNAIEKDCHYCMQSFPAHRPTEVIDLGDCKVEAKAWTCWGGG